MFEQDYIMRLIYEIIRTLLKLLFNIDTEKQEEIIYTEKEAETKYDDLLDLIDKGEINKAESILFNELNLNDLQGYQKALMFYSYLNEKEMEFLEEHDFSKNKIMNGLKYVSEIYGYGSIAEALLSTLLD
jgi:hypothetical protein